MKLRDEHYAILRYVNGGASKGPQGLRSQWVRVVAYMGAPFADRPGLWTALSRAGYLEPLRQSEQVRGERRQHWTEYRLSPAGKRALDDGAK